MKCGWIALAAGLTLMPAAAWAQDDGRPAAPYKPVPVTITLPTAPAGFEAFRAELIELAANRDRPALERLLVTQGFFWDNDREGHFDRAKPTSDNLSAALGFDGAEDTAGWGNLARLIAHNAAPHGNRRDVVCSPPRPKYSEADLDRLVAETDTELGDWGATRVTDLPVRLYPREDADTIEILGMHFVMIDGAEEPKATDARTWHIVMTPRGKRGYVVDSDLVFPFSDRLCFAKENDAWRIAGYIGAE